MIARIYLLLWVGCLASSTERPYRKPAESPAPIGQEVGGENPYYSKTDTLPLSNVPDSAWRRVLSPERYAVMRQRGTERAFTGRYWDFDQRGTYRCAACGNALFRSEAKFASGCGWPSFFEVTRPGSVRYLEDRSHGMVRTEVVCGRCAGHLGHVFEDGPPPTGLRFCMNSIALEFEMSDK